MELRPYQQTAVNSVMESFGQHRAVCLVAPTGSGKTVMAEAIVNRFTAAGGAAGGKVLFIAHRRELIKQAASRFVAPGVIMPGEPYSPGASIQVASVQTLLARDMRPAADLVVWDEAHHIAADQWGAVLDCYPAAKCLGLTATPQRSDGRPLGDTFSSLVIAEQYSKLIADGHLVPAKCFQPSEMIGDGLACDPLKAWRDLAGGTRTFAFASRVAQCEEFCATFNAAGIPSAVVEANTPTEERDNALRRFADGSLTVLWNVQALTEGVDIPAAETVLLARKVGHEGLFLQIAGRVLRPFPGKANARFIDLTGATLIHGRPDEDRIYTLDGAGIKRTSATPLRVCPQCGVTIEAFYTTCPECNYVWPPPKAPVLRIYSQELKEVFAGAETPEDAKAKEYRRLRNLAKAKGWSLYFVQKEYRKLFGVMPIITDATPQEKFDELRKLKEMAAQNGYKSGFASVRFKMLFGQWPGR